MNTNEYPKTVMYANSSRRYFITYVMSVVMTLVMRPNYETINY